MGGQKVIKCHHQRHKTLHPNHPNQPNQQQTMKQTQSHHKINHNHSNGHHKNKNAKKTKNGYHNNHNNGGMISPPISQKKVTVPVNKSVPSKSHSNHFKLNKKMSVSDFEMKKLIGKGSFGQVWCVEK